MPHKLLKQKHLDLENGLPVFRVGDNRPTIHDDTYGPI